MIDAVINLLKPPGMTSHDAVSFVRRVFKQKRVGHSGTLDPAAAGVLPVYLGNATRLVEYGEDFDKEYRAEIIFGVSTDTGDDTGTVLIMEQVGVSRLENMEAIVDSFAGAYEQVPPMYSALKVNGRKLYELARQGRSVERAARTVQIRSIRLVRRLADRVVIQVGCSKGTYIRTLCEDIGKRAGIPATMGFLLRTRVGPFDISQAATLEEIAASPECSLLPADHAVSRFPVYRLDATESRWLKQGRSVEIQPDRSVQADRPFVRLYSDTGDFFGIGKISSVETVLEPVKIFAGGKEKHVVD